MILIYSWLQPIGLNPSYKKYAKTNKSNFKPIIAIKKIFLPKSDDTEVIIIVTSFST